MRALANRSEGLGPGWPGPVDKSKGFGGRAGPSPVNKSEGLGGLAGPGPTNRSVVNLVFRTGTANKIDMAIWCSCLSWLESPSSGLQDVLTQTQLALQHDGLDWIG